MSCEPQLGHSMKAVSRGSLCCAQGVSFRTEQSVRCIQHARGKSTQQKSWTAIRIQILEVAGSSGKGAQAKKAWTPKRSNFGNAGCRLL